MLTTFNQQYALLHQYEYLWMSWFTMVPASTIIFCRIFLNLRNTVSHLGGMMKGINGESQWMSAIDHEEDTCESTPIPVWAGEREDVELGTRG